MILKGNSSKNLTDSMNKYWLLAIFSAVVISCSTDAGNFTIGEDLIKKESTVVMSDTFKVEMSTVLVDSIATSTPATALVGKYTNSVNGSTEFRHYVTFDLNSEFSSFDVEEFPKYNLDSITFKMTLADFYKGDTINPVTFNVHRLTSQLKFPGSGTTTGKLYNINSFAYDPTPMASYTFVPEPATDSIEIRLPDSFGLELMAMKVASNNIIKDNDAFLKYLKGFVVIPDAQANVVLGFKGTSPGIQLKLYTHRVKADIEEKEFDFNIASDGNNFNQSISDRTGTKFESLVNQREKLSSVSTDGITYIQGTAGFLTKLTFPSLNDIYGYGESVLIRAELVLVPSADNDYRNLPKTLNFYSSTWKNSWGNALTTTSSSGATVNVSATLVSDNINGVYYYSANVTDFLLDELKGNYYDVNNGLMIGFTTTNMTTQADYLFLTSQKVNQMKTKLNLYFLRYE